jgi:hypothetical protein
MSFFRLVKKEGAAFLLLSQTAPQENGEDEAEA